MNGASVCVFLGSTRADLDPDCRPAARHAITIATARLAEMDSWDTDYESPVSVCLRKVEQESTHYLGLFAYRRGWEPRAGRSITEAEFEWALGCRKGRMAVFLPNATSEFAQQLRERARAQEAEHAEAQNRFLARVSALGTFMVFDSPVDLACKVTRTVLRWAHGGLRACAGTGGRLHGGMIDHALHGLGRRAQLRQFEDTLDALPASCPGACFLVQGMQGQGHDDLARRLCLLLERRQGTPPVHFHLACSSNWGGGGPAAVLSRALGFDAPEPLEALAARLRSWLDATDVVLEVSGVQKHPGSLPGLLAGLWGPLLLALGPRARRRLFLLAKLERKALAEWPLQAPGPCAGFDPCRAVRLDALGPYTFEELVAWLGEWAPDRAESLAGDLIAETGGDPTRLVENLRECDLFAVEGTIP